MFTKILSLRGMKVTATDLLESRLKLGLKWGATRVFNAGEDTLVEDIRSAVPILDAAVIAVPSDTAVFQAMELVRGSAQILLFAHTRKGVLSQVDLSCICLEEKDLIGSYSADYSLQKEVARLVFSRRLDIRGIITHTFPLRQTAAAIALATRPTEESLKVIVEQ
jgi:L-iditol 2-dehydrogenase